MARSVQGPAILVALPASRDDDHKPACTNPLIHIGTDTLINSLYHFGISTLDLYCVKHGFSILQSRFSRKAKSSQVEFTLIFHKMQIEAGGVICRGPRLPFAYSSLLCMLFTLPFSKF